MIDKSQVTFDSIKSSIIEYLSANKNFKDYNYTAPAISTLIDALAYTSHYLIRYANFSLNECFLDSAQLRHNVVSRAKEVAYIPHSYSAARAKLRIYLNDTAYEVSNATKVPENTIFIGSIDQKTSYTFRTLNQAIFQKDNNDNWYADVEVVEGTWITEKFEQDEFYENRYFFINNTIDTDFMKVMVYTGTSSIIAEEYVPVSNIESFGPDYPIYYIQEAYNGNLEIYFGDGVLSKKLLPGAQIEVKYLVTHGSEANNITLFSLANNIGNIALNSFKIQVLEQSNSGGDREDIESIRYNAPKFFQRQDRNVTTSDYNVAVSNKFGGWINSITSWGGEDNIPPRYGEVFIAIKPKYTEVLSPSQKERITEFLKEKNMPCIDVNVIDAQYINVVLTLNIDWKVYLSKYTNTQIHELLEETVKKFFNTNVTSFKSSFRYSRFLTDLADVDTAVDSILTNIKLKQYIIPDTSIATTYTLNFLNRLEEGSLIVGPWTVAGSNLIYSMYDKDGIIYLSMSDGQKKVIGSINYNTGVVNIENYLFGVYSKAKIPVVVTPSVQNISLAKNYLLKIDDPDLVININEIKEYIHS